MTALPIYLAGDWRPGRGAPLITRNPANNAALAMVSTASAEDVDDAVKAAQVAMHNPDWRDLLPHHRAAYLHRIAALIERDSERLAQLQRQDNGKPILETRALVASAAGTFRFFAAACETLEGDITPSRGNYLSLSTHEPFGVIAAITPWNSPIASEAQKVAPALAAGNAVIIKPSEFSPLLALELAKLAEEAGLPKGLLSVLPGTGAVTGAALVAHPGIAKVTFTGGTATGRAIGHVAAEKIMPVSLELGGKSPNIVFADSDIEQAINGVLFGIFSSQGQSCIAGSRIFIEESIYAGFRDRLVERTKALRIGDPVSERTQIGPLITPQQRDKVEGYVRLAQQEGGRLLCGGTRPTDPALQDGNYFIPALIENLSNRCRTAQEEIFGPVGILLPFRDEAALINDANDTVFGLASGIWTSDFRRAWRIGRALNAGTVWVNTYKQFSIATAFGGNAESGLGREKGRDGIKAYMRQKSIYVDMSGRPIPWAD
ncbi:MAG: aldehyde dehydrogenase [Ferrovibrio sp.]|uniref:aldehyde dehydrogenase n=1 Tax=Ferrovibrio sp. TaxID=1917215 RepID=UPI00260C511D|nr:aldehyde dehydrogenase [Ferrovibrio sp.]MCW0234002.1 aldehyde dehydrogenase [Ferrovibrio sp.]